MSLSPSENSGDVTKKLSPVADAVKKGLLSEDKYLPNWYRYDKAGSAINDHYLGKQDYYLDRAEREILQSEAMAEMIEELPGPCVLVDMGCGNAEKTQIVIDALLKGQGNVQLYAVDISEGYLQKTCERLRTVYNNQSVDIIPVPGDYSKGAETLSEINGSKFILWLGGLQMESVEDQIGILREFTSHMSDNDRLFVSADVTQDRQAVERAYVNMDVSQDYLLNSIHRLNADFNANIHIGSFELEKKFVQETDPAKSSYVLGHLISLRPQTYDISDLNMRIAFEVGERLNLSHFPGYSCKFTLEQIFHRVKSSNAVLQKCWMDTGNHVVIFCIKKATADLLH